MLFFRRSPKSAWLAAVKLIGVALVAWTLTGCMVGPSYRRPKLQTPVAYRSLAPEAGSQPSTESYADLPWWQVFQDPKLQELIRAGLKQNYDLQMATERINAARAQVSITRSD